MVGVSTGAASSKPDGELGVGRVRIAKEHYTGPSAFKHPAVLVWHKGLWVSPTAGHNCHGRKEMIVESVQCSESAAPHRPFEDSNMNDLRPST